MTWGKVFGVLWSIALGIMALKCLVDLVRDGHVGLGVAVVILPLGALVFFRARSVARRVVPVAGKAIGEGPELLRQLAEPDQLRIANLAASGKAIEAIKLTRALLHVSLRAAKEAVDQLSRPGK